MAPAEVNKENEKELWNKLYGDYVKTGSKRKPGKFKTGETVVITKKRKPFAKSYLPQWRDQKYMIVDELPTKPPVWRLMDIGTQEIVKTRFYPHELQKASL